MPVLLDPQKILQFWAAGPDTDPYRLVMREFALNKPQARRAVRSALRGRSLFPHTDEQYRDIRLSLLKGDGWWNELI